MNGNSNALLFDGMRDPKGQQEILFRMFAHIEDGALAGFADSGFFYEKEG